MLVSRHSCGLVALRSDLICDNFSASLLPVDSPSGALVTKGQKRELVLPRVVDKFFHDGVLKEVDGGWQMVYRR